MMTTCDATNDGSFVKFMTFISQLEWCGFLPEARFGLRVLSSHASVCASARPSVRPSVRVWGNHLLVHAITRDPFKLGSPNLDQRYKRVGLRPLLFFLWQLMLTFKVKLNIKLRIYPLKLGSVLFWVAIDLDLQVHIWLKKLNFLVSPLLEIHNHHITTKEPWLPASQAWLFMVFILCAYLYIDCFTVATVSQSQHVAHTLEVNVENIRNLYVCRNNSKSVFDAISANILAGPIKHVWSCWILATG